jgi:hypothetical protein
LEPEAGLVVEFIRKERRVPNPRSIDAPGAIPPHNRWNGRSPADEDNDLNRFGRLRHIIFYIIFMVIMMSLLSFLENFLLYHPFRTIELTPASYGVPFEEVRFTAADGVKLHGWYVAPEPPKGAGPGKPGGSDIPTGSGNPDSSHIQDDPDGPDGSHGAVILWAHGNAGNLSHRAENIAFIRRELGAGVFLFDYRGYGLSEGSPDEEGLYADARAAYAWLRGRTSPGRIFLFGRSLGAAVMVKLASEGVEARGLILESTFESLLAMGKKMFPILPVDWIITQKFDTAALIPSVKMPVFVLHGSADEIIPFSQGQAVFSLAPRPKRFFRIIGAGHNDTYRAGGPSYWDAWREFLASPGGGASRQAGQSP